MQRLDNHSPLLLLGRAVGSFLCWGDYGVTSEGNRKYTRLIQACPHLCHKCTSQLSKPQLDRASTSKLLHLGDLPNGDRRSGYPCFKPLRSCAATDNSTKIRRASPPPQEDLPARQTTLGSCAMWNHLHSFHITPGFYLPCLGLSAGTPVNVLSGACNPGTGIISEDVGTSAVGHYLSRGKFHSAFGKQSNLRKEFHDQAESKLRIPWELSLIWQIFVHFPRIPKS